jgi:hypothetical protein
MTLDLIKSLAASVKELSQHLIMITDNEQIKMVREKIIADVLFTRDIILKNHPLLQAPRSGL